MKNVEFQPDYSNILKVLYNKRPDYLPLYEHHIDPPFISKCIGEDLSVEACTTDAELDEYFRKYIAFWRNHTYDAFDYEAAICDIFPDHGAIMGGRPGPIQTREDFEKYPFKEIPELFWNKYKPRLESIRRVMPPGMKAYGGCGYGIFESSQDLVGYENLCIMQFINPELFRDLFNKIGELYQILWRRMVSEYNDIFVFFRMGDDLGFKTSTMLAPETIKEFILPQHKKVIDIVHGSGKKFLLHCCGNIFNIMPDILANGIDAKHSNEDQIAPYDRWIDDYKEQIGLFGGIDMNYLIMNSYNDIYKKVLEDGTKFRAKANGYGLGSGNSIPEYMNIDGFEAMIAAVKEIRRRELLHTGTI